MSETGLIMAKKRTGRPKAGGRIPYRYSLVATAEHRTWMEEFMKTTGKTDVSDVFREALRHYAKNEGFRMPPPI